MEFVRRNTSIPVPKVYDILEDKENIYIVMEYIEGKMLAEVWTRLTSEQKGSIVNQLKGYLAELRALSPPHPGRVESVDGTEIGNTTIGPNRGPFDSVESFHRARGYSHIRSSPDKYPRYKDVFNRIKGKKYRTVFTHGDFSLHNILVNKDMKIAAIIDWEFAGWYPEYWEYTQGHFSNTRYTEFQDILKRGDILEKYEDELQAEKFLATIFTRV